MRVWLLNVAVFASLIVALGNGLVDATLWGMTRPSVLLWLVMGLACMRSEHPPAARE